MLKQKVKDYLEFSGISKSLFCRRINVSTQHLYTWLRGQNSISLELETRISKYLDKYGRRISSDTKSD